MLSDQMFIEALKQEKSFNFEIAEQLKRAAFDESANDNPILEPSGESKNARG